MRLIHIIYFTLVSLFWGCSFLAIRIAIAEFPTSFAAFLRIAICLIFLIPYLYFYNKRRKTETAKNLWKLPKKIWPQSMLSGLFVMAIPWILLFWGQKYVTPALAAILNSTTPIFVAVLMPLLTPQDKLSLRKWLGVIVGFMGIIIIFGPELHAKEISFHLWGLIAILFMSICYAIGTLWTRKLTKHAGVEINLFYQCLGGMLLISLYTIFFEPEPISFNVSYKAILAVIYLGIFSSALAWLMYCRILRDVGSVQAAAITFCVPVTAIILDAVFLNKIPLSHQAIGACLILLSVFIINRQKKKPSYL